jgi:hypothetical protein
MARKNFWTFSYTLRNIIHSQQHKKTTLRNKHNYNISSDKMVYNNITGFVAYDYGYKRWVGLCVCVCVCVWHPEEETQTVKITFIHTNGALPSSKYPLWPDILQGS